MDDHHQEGAEASLLEIQTVNDRHPVFNGVPQLQESGSVTDFRRFAGCCSLVAAMDWWLIHSRRRGCTPEIDPPVPSEISDPVDVGHAGIHQFPEISAGKSEFFGDVNLGALSRTEGVEGVLQGNGNFRYVLRGTGDIGVDRTTGLPTDIYTVIRRPNGSVVTMFPGTSPRS
ncbi:hypothetical protein [Kribbella sp. NPDC004536]|uniref:hypothetical protein n=1 Tax=Kribbella sp. NPDC004536 TaxID=3364106 RepID=UPI00369C271A